MFEWFSVSLLLFFVLFDYFFTYLLFIFLSL